MITGAAFNDQEKTRTATRRLFLQIDAGLRYLSFYQFVTKTKYGTDVKGTKCSVLDPERNHSGFGSRSGRIGLLKLAK